MQPNNAWTQQEVETFAIGGYLQYLGDKCRVTEVLREGSNYRGILSKVLRVRRADRRRDHWETTLTIAVGDVYELVTPNGRRRDAKRFSLHHPNTVTVNFDTVQAAADYLWNFRKLPDFALYFLRDNKLGLDSRPFIVADTVGFD